MLLDFFKTNLLKSSNKLEIFGANLAIYVFVVNDLDNGNWLLLAGKAVTGLGGGEVGDNIF